MTDYAPITPHLVTVLGYRVKATDPRWTGLDFANAELLERASILVLFFGTAAPPDHHLSVPYRGGAGEDMRYRVRPRRKGWRFVRVNNEWMIERTSRRKRQGLSSLASHAVP